MQKRPRFSGAFFCFESLTTLRNHCVGEASASRGAGRGFSLAYGDSGDSTNYPRLGDSRDRACASGTPVRSAKSAS